MTGFGFPTQEVTPPQIVGVISLLVLGVCLAARNWKRLQGCWRSAYVISAVVAFFAWIGRSSLRAFNGADGVRT